MSPIPVPPYIERKRKRKYRTVLKAPASTQELNITLSISTRSLVRLNLSWIELPRPRVLPSLLFVCLRCVVLLLFVLGPRYRSEEYRINRRASRTLDRLPTKPTNQSAATSELQPTTTQPAQFNDVPALQLRPPLDAYGSLPLTLGRAKGKRKRKQSMDARARFAHITSGTPGHAAPLEAADDEGASRQVLQRGDIRRVGVARDLAHLARIERTIGQRKRMLGMVKEGVITTSAGRVERVSDNGGIRGGTEEGDMTPMSSLEEQRGVKRKVDACGHIIPEEEFDELIEPKVESPGDDAALALIESHRRSSELMSPMAAKRPRGRPRKHPVVPESINKVTKGRSKTGCITCRKRKKKCDEMKPRCTFWRVALSPT
mgnify:CR=1 FL=1